MRSGQPAFQAVNTLRRDGVRWLGCNTDVSGFRRRSGVDAPARCARTILGAGGAARSVPSR